MHQKRKCCPLGEPVKFTGSTRWQPCHTRITSGGKWNIYFYSNRCFPILPVPSPWPSTYLVAGTYLHLTPPNDKQAKSKSTLPLIQTFDVPHQMIGSRHSPNWGLEHSTISGLAGANDQLVCSNLAWGKKHFIHRLANAHPWSRDPINSADKLLAVCSQVVSDPLRKNKNTCVIICKVGLGQVWAHESSQVRCGTCFMHWLIMLSNSVPSFHGVEVSFKDTLWYILIFINFNGQCNVVFLDLLIKLWIIQSNPIIARSEHGLVYSVVIAKVDHKKMG